MKIYGETYQNNVEFYTYTRALEAYRTMFNDNTVIILDEDSPILDIFFSGAVDAQHE
jgi:regulator of protease activity HflC (stomatin/prohibitin superfamily)